MIPTHGLANVTLLVLATLCSMGCGAATKQAREMSLKGGGLILDDHSILRPGRGDEALWVYEDQATDWSVYTRIMVDPVLFQAPSNASQDVMADLQTLAGNLHAYLVEQLGKDFKVVTSPESGTLRLQMAFYNPEKKGSTHVLSSVIPVGALASLGKDFITGKPLSVGEVSGEARLTDAVSGKLLGAALDRRVGTQWGEGMTDAWAEVDSAMEYWAKRMRYFLCKVRGGTDCEEPSPR